jgi:catechol 2,3-dioxygenase-like lactoylglutathione lyase family enzyme
MINWAKRIDVIDLYVEDVEGTKASYESTFGLPANRHPAGVDFAFGDTILHLRDVGTAHEFIEPASADRSAWAKTPKQVGRITLFAEDLDLAKSFYQDVFGLPVEPDGHGLGFRLAGVSVGLLGMAAARELIGPTAVGDPDAAVRFTFCTFVDQVEAVRADLAVRGVRLFRETTDFAFGHRLVSLRDPSGHIWEIVGEVPAADAAES